MQFKIRLKDNYFTHSLYVGGLGWSKNIHTTDALRTKTDAFRLCFNLNNESGYYVYTYVVTYWNYQQVYRGSASSPEAVVNLATQVAQPNSNKNSSFCSLCLTSSPWRRLAPIESVARGQQSKNPGLCRGEGGIVSWPFRSAFDSRHCNSSRVTGRIPSFCRHKLKRSRSQVFVCFCVAD